MRRNAVSYGFVFSVTFVAGCGSQAGNGHTTKTETAGAGGSASNPAGGGASNPVGGAGPSGGSSSSGGSSGAGPAGGQAGTEGNGGTTTAPPVIIADCGALPEVGVWEQVAPPEAGPPTSLAVDPVNSGTVYFGTSNGLNKDGTMGVWKSTDCGATWTHINTGTEGGKCSSENDNCGPVIDNGRIWSFGINHVDPEVLYVNNGYGQGDLGLMKSTDGGVNWWQVWPPCDDPQNCFGSKTDPVNQLAPGFLGDVVVDPYDPDHILVDFHAPCTNVEFCIGESTDAGASWKVVEGDPAMGSAHESRLGFLDNSETWAFIAGGIWVTRNSGATWEKTSNGGGGGMHYKASNGAYYVGAGDAIFRSTDVGDSWAQLPETGPFIQGLVGDGETIFASKFAVGFDWGDDLKPYISTNEADGTSWQAYDSPGFNQGAIQLGIDLGHHLMFSANSEDGFWRVRIK